MPWCGAVALGAAATPCLQHIPSPDTGAGLGVQAVVREWELGDPSPTLWVLCQAPCPRRVLIAGS